MFLLNELSVRPSIHRRRRLVFTSYLKVEMLLQRLTDTPTPPTSTPTPKNPPQTPTFAAAPHTPLPLGVQLPNAHMRWRPFMHMIPSAFSAAPRVVSAHFVPPQRQHY